MSKKKKKLGNAKKSKKRQSIRNNDLLKAEKQEEFILERTPAQIWEEICKIVDKDIENLVSIEDKYADISNIIPRVWIAIRKERFPEDKISEYSDNQLKVKKMLDDEIYYQEVKYFTHDFKFLGGLPEEGLGEFPGRKFIDKESYNRYCNLREALTYSHEEIQIKRLLEGNEIDDVTSRILAERLKVIERNKFIAENGNLSFVVGNHEDNECR